MCLPSGGTQLKTTGSKVEEVKSTEIKQEVSNTQTIEGEYIYNVTFIQFYWNLDKKLVSE